MPLDFPTSPTDGQQYNGYVYSSATGAWRGKPASSSPVYTTAAAPPNPVAGDMWWNSNDGTMYVYYKDADAYQWVEVRSQIAKSQVGLVPIIPTAITAVTGTASLSPSGKVSFTAISRINLSGVFTSKYANYKIVYTLDAYSTPIDSTRLRLSAGGTDNTLGDYSYGGWYVNRDGGYGFLNGNSQNIWYAFSWNGAYNTGGGTIDIQNPWTANIWPTYQSVGTSSYRLGMENISGAKANTGQFDGFSFVPSSSRLTGTVQVYGYNE